MADLPEAPSGAPAGVRSGAGGKGGLLGELQKMPVWGWFLIAAGAFVGYKLFLAGGSSPTAATADTSGTGSPSGDTSGGGGDSDGGAADPGSPSGPGGNGGPAQPVAPSPAPTPAPSSNPPTPAPTPPKGPGGNGGPAQPANPPHPKRTYTVRDDDTLVAIGQREGVAWESIYDANAGVIEQTAQQRSGHGSDHGHWIYPGEVLVIP